MFILYLAAPLRSLLLPLPTNISAFQKEQCVVKMVAAICDVFIHLFACTAQSQTQHFTSDMTKLKICGEKYSVGRRSFQMLACFANVSFFLL